MNTGKEGIQSQPTLSDLVRNSSNEFNARKLDQSGFGPNHLDLAVITTMVASGLSGNELLGIVQKGSSLDSESIQVIIAEAAEGFPDHAELVAAGRIIVEEITTNDSEIATENARRIQVFTGPLEGKVVQKKLPPKSAV